VLAATLPSTPVICTSSEAAKFDPPPGSTCGDYAAKFVAMAGRGYLANPGARSGCEFCPFKNGTEYMATLNVYPSDKWRDLGIFAAFCVSNWALVYFFIYMVRIRGWTFGFGTLFGVMGRLVRGLKGLLSGLKREKRNTEI
jgi:ATP-binding cassette, subfamily G (WHITE), member 2, SNQ2